MQMLLAQFSQANSSLAVETDKLRTGRQELAAGSAGVRSEIEYLRSRLNVLEASASCADRATPLSRSAIGSAAVAAQNESDLAAGTSTLGTGALSGCAAIAWRWHSLVARACTRPFFARAN